MSTLKTTDFADAWAYIAKKCATSDEMRAAVVTAVRMVQTDVGVTVDGKLGPGTATAVQAANSFKNWVFPLQAPKRGATVGISSHHADSNPSRPTHRGADIMYKRDGRWHVPACAAVLASFRGTVVRREERSNGWCLAIETADGHIYQHRHMAEPYVALGKVVMTGEKLGLLDQTQNPPHVHFELYARGVYDYNRSLDPRPALAEMRVVKQ